MYSLIKIIESKRLVFAEQKLYQKQLSWNDITEYIYSI